MAAFTAALTVYWMTKAGLPVSTTHIVVGAVFGVGFFREYYTARSRRRRYYVLKEKRHAPVSRKSPTTPDELRRRKLVRRSHFVGIIAAWPSRCPLPLRWQR